MFAKKYRPRTFEEVIGQEPVKDIFKKVVASPEGKPQLYILQGAFGSGKTTLARVFGRAINCTAEVKPCLKCESCCRYGDILDDPRYLEYDSAQTGNVETIKNLRDTWSFLPGSDYKTLVLDELQTSSKSAQSALLNFTEDPPKRVFIIFCTTDVEKLIEPLVSRSFPLEFYPLTGEEIERVVDSISLLQGLNPSEKVRGVISRRSGGHARDAVHLLERFSILGEVGFLESVIMADSLLFSLFKYSIDGDKDKVRLVVGKLAQIPLEVLKEDFERVMRKLMDRVFLDGKVPMEVLNEALLMKMFTFYNRFYSLLEKSTSDAASFLIALSSLMRQQISSPKEDQSSIRYKK